MIPSTMPYALLIFLLLVILTLQAQASPSLLYIMLAHNHVWGIFLKEASPWEKGEI